MNLKPSESLSQRQITNGLNLVIKEGMATEAMSALTGGTFLVAMAILLGASNMQIGVLAALPSFSSLFQLVAVKLLQKYNNRRIISVISNVFARLPLLIIGVLPLIFTKSTSIEVLIFLLFFHYFFGSVAGANWNSWMKDLVPEKKLGSYFSQRTRLTQTLNVFLSLTIALLLDYVKRTHPGIQLVTYSYMFIGGGILGLFGTWLLSKTPEPASYLAKENLFKLFKKPLMDKNFRNLLIFNSFWSFSLNIATPFFTVYMMRTLNLPLSYIICFGILGQIAGIFAVKIWGRRSDDFSNKTIIKIAAPVFIFCILSWPLAGMAGNLTGTIIIVALINILSGASTCGINLAIGNMGLKLASKDQAIVYLSVKNIIVAFFASMGPLLGGFLADFFSDRSFAWNIELDGPNGVSIIHLFELHSLGFLFIIGGVLAFISIKLLHFVKEEGEVPKELAIAKMRVGIRTGFRDKMRRESVLSLLSSPATYQKSIQRKFRKRFGHGVINMKRWRSSYMMKRVA